MKHLSTRARLSVADAAMADVPSLSAGLPGLRQRDIAVAAAAAALREERETWLLARRLHAMRLQLATTTGQSAELRPENAWATDGVAVTLALASDANLALLNVVTQWLARAAREGVRRQLPREAATVLDDDGAGGGGGGQGGAGDDAPDDDDSSDGEDDAMQRQPPVKEMWGSTRKALAQARLAGRLVCVWLLVCSRLFVDLR